MLQKSNAAIKETSPYNAAFTREQFLFYEMRTTAKLICEGLTDDEVADQIVNENLFQYPTEKSIRKMALACIRRLNGLDDNSLVEAIANQPSAVSKQICMYAMMKQYRVVWDFMVTVIGEKYRLKDMSFSKMDLNVFFIRLQEQDDWVATWSESTINKLKQVLTKVLVENEYLDDTKATTLNPVLLTTILENAIRNNHDDVVFPAFNYFS